MQQFFSLYIASYMHSHICPKGFMLTDMVNAIGGTVDKYETHYYVHIQHAEVATAQPIHKME